MIFFFFFTKGRNPHGGNENSNTIYRPDLTCGSNAEAAEHSRFHEIEVIVLTTLVIANTDRKICEIDLLNSEAYCCCIFYKNRNILYESTEK